MFLSKLKGKPVDPKKPAHRPAVKIKTVKVSVPVVRPPVVKRLSEIDGDGDGDGGGKRGVKRQATGKHLLSTSSPADSPKPVSSRSASAESDGRGARKASASRRRKSADLNQFNRASSSSEEEGTDTWEDDLKRFSSSTPGLEDFKEKDTTRTFLNPNVNYGPDPVRLNIINAADITKKSKSTYLNCFKGLDKALTITLESPVINCGERYTMVEPSMAAEFRPAAEIDQVMEMVASTFVPPKYTNQIKHPLLEDCILRRIRRSLKNNNSEEFQNAIEEYNELLRKIKLENDQTLLIRDMGCLPQNFVYAMLDQVYARVVSPEVDELRNYEAFSNNVYGELLPSFMTRIFNLTKIKSTSVFVDLGSGVGNCVLQAALETGCESWGCEMMAHASTLAAKQKAELRQRLKLFGINHGKITLNNQSFVYNDEIQKALQRVDVLLVNNYAFDGQLNGHLIDMFLDLKDGCKIVSLKSFVPPGHVISEHNIESPLNMLEVQKYEFYSGSVSWTDAPGPFYIATVNRSRIQKYLKRRR